MLRKKFIFGVLLSGLIIGCSNGGNDEVTSGDTRSNTDAEPGNNQLPELQSLSNSEFIQGEAVSITIPNSGAGELISCSAPELPPHLSIGVSNDLQDCIITGDGFTVLSPTEIEVTATNLNGSSSILLPISINQASPFILNVRAAASEASGQRTFVIRHNPSLTYDYTIDWGDGSDVDISDGSEDLIHTYTGNAVSVFTVTITGLYPQQSLSRSIRTDESIVSIEQWGNQPWKSLEAAFSNVHDLAINASDVPNLKHTSTLSRMFENAEGFDEDISQWDISNVGDMSGIFSGTKLSVELYDLILNSWANLPLKENVVFDAGDSRFSDNGIAARNILSENFFWQITDLGSAAPHLSTTVDQIKIYTNIDAAFPFKNEGENVTECESNNLPIGVSVEAIGGTCRINGIPNSATEITSSTIVATNEFGQSSIDFDIQVLAESPYVTRWKTDNEGETNNNSITIYTSESFDYDFTVDWGDGSIDEGITETITHTYTTPGEYQVSITGNYPKPHFPNTNNSDAHKLVSVDSWGNRPWLSMNSAFRRTNNLTISPSTAPDLSRVIDMSKMFELAEGFNSEIGHWDVSNIETMASLFSRARAFNQDIGNWNVSNVRTMSSMFSNASAFNQNIENWDVKNVENMRSMFNFAQNFNQPIGDWDTSSLKNMAAIFRAARKFNQSIENWNTSLVTTMSELFDGAVNFNQPIGNWNTSSVRDMRKTFNIASKFNQDISDWDVSSVTNMNIMFKQAGSFNQDIGEWDVSSVTNMDNMFERANQFDQDLSQWDIRSVNGTQVLNRTFSTENYDAMLISWSALEGIQEGIILEAGDSLFSPSSKLARDTLINNFGWTINDGGVVVVE